MFEGEVARRRRNELRELAAAMVFITVAVSAWGALGPATLTPELYDGMTTGEEFTVIVVTSEASLLILIACVLGGVALAEVWTLVAERRLPWPLRSRQPRLEYWWVLRVIPLMAGYGLAQVLLLVLPDGYPIGTSMEVDVSRAPAYEAGRMVALMAGVGFAWLGITPMAWIIHRLDPGRRLAWIKVPDAASSSPPPDPVATQPEPAA